MSLSFDQKREMVRHALEGAHSLGQGSWLYIVELFDDAAVYEIEGPAGNNGPLYYRRSYAIVDGKAQLGEPQAVKKQVDYIPMQAAGRLLAATGEPGSEEYGYIWRVQVNEYGLGKDKRINWPKEPLVAALPLIDGARVFALNESQHQASSKPYGKSVKEIVGWLKNPADTGTAIEADLYILKSAKWLRDGLVDSHERGNPTLFGLSFDATGRAMTKMVAGHKVKEPVEITAVEVDVVYNPTNAGKFIRMAAAAAEREEEVKREQLLAALAKVKPGLQTDNLTDEELLQALTAAAVEAAGGNTNNEQLAAAIVAGLKESLNAGGTGDDALKEVRRMQAGIVLDRELAASKLPEKFQASLRTRFENQEFKTEDLQAAIRSTKEAIDDLTASGTVLGAGGVRVLIDQREKVDQCLDDFFDKKTNSFKAAYQDITGDLNFTGQMRNATRLTASIQSGTFAEALGDAITRKMLKEYKLAGLDDWRKICEVTPLNDFRTQHRPRMGGYGDLPGVNEGAGYGALGSPGDEEMTFAPSKRGGTEDVTLEAIRNDDVQVIRRIPVKLSRAAARTLYKFVFAFLDTNSAIYDAKALFHVDHANLKTDALDKAKLQAARLQMTQQKDFGSNDFLGIPPRYLIVPSNLEDTAYELTVKPTQGQFQPTQADSVRRQTWELIVNLFWTDVNNWFLAADPADVPMIEMGFLDGKEEPELFVQDMPNVGSMFSNDKLTYKIRHIYGGAVADFRGFQGNVVAG